MRKHGILKGFFGILAFLAAVVIFMSEVLNLRLIERVRYEWRGAGTEIWEQEAAEAGIGNEVEEYHYWNLPEELQTVYREIFVHIMKDEDQGALYSEVAVDDFWRTYYAVLADHPEIFWMDSSAQAEESGLTGRVVNYSFDTVVPVEERAAMRAQLEATANECIYSIPDGATEYEKIKFVYEYIINMAEYNSEGKDNQNIQSVLLYHNSVCAGYSKAFQYILNRMGIFCTYVTGTIRNGGDHGWNMVRIGENYYYVDVTWGDPVFVNQLEGSGDQVMNYNYLCCTEDELFRTHIPDDTMVLPVCDSDDYNYYKLNNKYYEVFDYNTIYIRLMESVWNGESSIVLKFGSYEAYAQAYGEMFEGNLLKDAGQYLMEINGVSTWNYRYHTDEEFYLITLYWM